MIYLQPYKKYAVFESRASRKEFWTFKLFFFLVTLAWLAIVNILGSGHSSILNGLSVVLSIAFFLFCILSIIPSIAVSIRRLHDTNRSGWFLLLLLIPIIGPLVLIITFCLKSTPGDNRYGANPYAKDNAQDESV